MSTHSEFKELVVFRITTSCYPHIHIDPLSLARQSREKTSNVSLIDVSAELFSAQNFVEFGEGCKRKQNSSFSERQIKSLARLRTGQEHRADQDVRIEDAAQLCALQQGIQRLQCQPPSLRLTPHLSSTCWRDGNPPAASSRSQRLKRAWIFRFSSGGAASYARAVSGSSGIVIVQFVMVVPSHHSTSKNPEGCIP